MVTDLSADEVQAFNTRFVGPDHLRDFGLLDAAVTRPQSSAFGDDAFPTIHEKAAALLHGLSATTPLWTATSGPPGRPCRCST
jgi:death-on-curing protein